MSIVFHAQGWLTIAQLTRAWGRELAKGGDRNEVAHHLVHFLVVDIVNGRLDNSGPLREDGRRLGLRLITPENKAGFVEGQQLRDVLHPRLMSSISHRIVIMKEAALDFARRHKLPRPSWWADGAGLSTGENPIGGDSSSSTARVGPVPDDRTRRGGRKPKKLEQAREAMRGDILAGRLTSVGLRDMLEKDLAASYGVSRDTARKARDVVLSEMPPEATGGLQGGACRAWTALLSGMPLFWEFNSRQADKRQLAARQKLSYLPWYPGSRRFGEPIGLRTIMAKLVRPIRTACSRADGVSRDTARKGEAAHQMSLLSEIQFPTIATNDN
jgi:hypothetical protein